MFQGYVGKFLENWKAFFTLFQIVTLDSWTSLSRPLGEASPLAGLIIVTLAKIGMGGFLGFLDRLNSRELTYHTCGKGMSSSKVPLTGDMLVPRRVIGI